VAASVLLFFAQGKIPGSTLKKLLTGCFQREFSIIGIILPEQKLLILSFDVRNTCFSR
jgi:hypothetical protein